MAENDPCAVERLQTTDSKNRLHQFPTVTDRKRLCNYPRRRLQVLPESLGGLADHTSRHWDAAAWDRLMMYTPQRPGPPPAATELQHTTMPFVTFIHQQIPDTLSFGSSVTAYHRTNRHIPMIIWETDTHFRPHQKHGVQRCGPLL